MFWGVSDVRHCIHVKSGNWTYLQQNFQAYLRIDSQSDLVTFVNKTLNWNVLIKVLYSQEQTCGFTFFLCCLHLWPMPIHNFPAGSVDAPRCLHIHPHILRSLRPYIPVSPNYHVLLTSSGLVFVRRPAGIVSTLTWIFPIFIFTRI